MAKRGRRATNPKTIANQNMKNPPQHILEWRSRRQRISFLWKKVWCTTEKHHEAVEAIRKELQVSRNDLDRVLAGYLEGATEEQLDEAWSVLDTRREKIDTDVSSGGRAKSREHRPEWHQEAMRLAGEVKSSRAGIEVKLTDSQLAKFILGRWSQSAIKAPSHKTLRVYLGKSL